MAQEGDSSRALGAGRVWLAVAAGAALFWGWVLLVEELFEGQAGDLMPVHGLASVLALALAVAIGRPSGRPGRAFACVVLGFAGMALLAALAWYGYVLPEACERATEEWERGQAPSHGRLATAFSC